MAYPRETLTKKQRIALELIRIRIQETGYPPTVRELCEALGVQSSATAFKYLKILERRVIYGEKREDRAIKLLPQTGIFSGR